MSGSDFKPRLSMNRILMNARIFDEDSVEALSNSENDLDIKVKQEVKVEIDTANDMITSENKPPINPMIFKNEDTTFPKNVFDNLDLKNDEVIQYLTPVKLETDNYASSSVDLNACKSAKRTVFPRDSPYKTRQSPYKKSSQIELNSETSLFNRDHQINKPTKDFRKKKELETDLEILQRRQKQIDYGKNTTGYDNYINTVPRSKRSATDPQTPNKYIKYSRRGFDGLIKQWRLKLHKYDPLDD